MPGAKRTHFAAVTLYETGIYDVGRKRAPPVHDKPRPRSARRTSSRPQQRKTNPVFRTLPFLRQRLPAKARGRTQGPSEPFIARTLPPGRAACFFDSRPRRVEPADARHASPPRPSSFRGQQTASFNDRCRADRQAHARALLKPVQLHNHLTRRRDSSPLWNPCAGR